jgi:uncharacterized protein (DUF697 family)
MMPAKLSAPDRRFIHDAAEYFENPRLLMRFTEAIGRPVEQVAAHLPETFHEIIRASLLKGLAQIVRTINTEDLVGSVGSRAEPPSGISAWRHAGAAAATGAVGGFFGLAGLAVELPISTGIMLRSIAVTAHECGEDVTQYETLLECLAVLSQGGPSEADDAMNDSYYTSRVAMAAMTREAAKYIGGVSAKQFAKDVARGTAPAIVRLIAQVAGRFNVVVGQKLAAQAVPIVGAVGGAGINLAFADHFNKVAKYHFGIRRLEREHGFEQVQAAYQAELRALKGASHSPAQ